MVLEYRTPERRWARCLRPWLWILPLVMWITAGGIWIAGAVFVVPHYERIFMDFKMELPETTKVLLWSSELIRGHYGWIALVLAVLFVAVVIRRSRHPLRWASVLFLIGFMVAIGSALFFMIATAMPIIVLISAAAGTAAR